MPSVQRTRPIIFLQGRRIYFRPLEPADTQKCQRWINDFGTRQYMLNVRPMTEIEERRFIEGIADRKDDVIVAIMTRAGRHLIGSCGLHAVCWTDRRATFGIMIGEPAYRGKGYGTEATSLMLKHAFETLNLNRVDLDVYDFNEAGIRAYEKVGFVREGVFRQYRFAHGRYADVFRYSVLAEEYFARNGPSAQDPPS